MSNISQFLTTNSRKKNRRIIHGGVGLTTVTWLVPPGVTEVEVHCWGAGGAGGNRGGGGGGGYVTHVFPVTPSDQLLITAGASPGGTSSVSVPTQSPGSPISATGGSVGGSNPSIVGGAGGVGSYTIAAGITTSRTFSASGGRGGDGRNSPTVLGGGGAAAGSPFGTGGAGGFVAHGGGIGAPGDLAGGGTLGLGLGKNGYKVAYPLSGVDNFSVDADWFYVDEILGAGGSSTAPNAGAGGGGYTGNGNPLGAGNGGILGGGGSAGAAGGGNGGLAGGGGGTLGNGGGLGGAGLVILYW